MAGSHSQLVVTGTALAIVHMPMSVWLGTWRMAHGAHGAHGTCRMDYIFAAAASGQLARYYWKILIETHAEHGHGHD